jgi:hypothetical protein
MVIAWDAEETSHYACLVIVIDAKSILLWRLLADGAHAVLCDQHCVVVGRRQVVCRQIPAATCILGFI